MRMDVFPEFSRPTRRTFLSYISTPFSSTSPLNLAVPLLIKALTLQPMFFVNKYFNGIFKKSK
jgi:hypothetical protein